MKKLIYISILTLFTIISCSIEENRSLEQEKLTINIEKTIEINKNLKLKESVILSNFNEIILEN